MNSNADNGSRLACLGLGSNVNPWRNLPEALRLLRSAVEVRQVSGAWQSPAVGAAGPDYLNAAVLITTKLDKEGLTARLKAIEDVLGRDRTHSPVTIDIDLLVFGGEILDDSLWTQAYRALPAAEVCPWLQNPSGGEPLPNAAARLARLGPIQRHHSPLDNASRTSHDPSGAASTSTPPTWIRTSST